MTPTFVLHTYLKGGLKNETDKNNGIHNLIARNFTYGNKYSDYETVKNDLQNLLVVIQV